MRRTVRAISIGALLGVLGSLLVSVPVQAAPIAVTNTCTGNVCTDTSLVNIRGIASAPLVVKYNLGSFGCNDNGFICGSARTSGVTATSIEWKWEQQNAFNQWDGSSTIVSHTCTSTPSSTSTYCADGQHIDQLVISGLSSVKIIRVQFRLVNGTDTTSWMAGRTGASEYEYVVPSTFVPTAAISAAMFLEVNESFTASAENSVANDGYSDLSQSRFSWDFYSTNQYDVSNTASPTYAYAYSRSGTHTMKLRISNYHSVTDTETRVVYVSNVSPSSTASVSLQGGGIWTNTTRPTLEISWPKYAMTMNLADQDRSASNMEVRSSVDWDVTWGSGSGETKNITIDFLKGDGNSVGGQLTTAVSYDIDAPLLNSVTSTRTDGALSFSLSATDQHSGVSKVEISNGTTTVEHAYATSINSSLSGSNFSVRVMDLAGNWSNAQNIAAANVTTPPPASAPNQVTDSVPGPSGAVSGSNTVVAPAPPPVPRVAIKSKTAGVSIARQAGVSIAPGSKVSISVAKASKKICKVSGGRLVALKPGNCRVTVSVTPKKTKILKKPKAVRTPTTVVVG
jgi:hypothetical protein